MARNDPAREIPIDLARPATRRRTHSDEPRAGWDLRDRPSERSPERTQTVEDWARVVLFALVAGVVIALFLQPLWQILDRVPLIYGEGWNAYNAVAAISGIGLYPPPDAFIANNYPPLSFYVVGALGHAFGDNIIAGRFLALASLFLVAANVYLILRELGASRWPSSFAAVLFLAYIGAHFSQWVALDEPQWFGHALVTSGLVLFLRSRHAAAQRLPGIAAPVLMLAAGFVKFNLIPLPLAVLIWCAIYDRAELRRWLVIGAMLGAFGLALCWVVFGADFFADVLFAPRPYALARAFDAARKWLGPLLLLLGGSVWLFIAAGRDPGTRLVLLWVVLGGVFGIGFVAGAGVSRNTFFDFSIALCVAAGLLLSRLAQPRTKSYVVPLLGLILLLSPLYRLPSRMGHLASAISGAAERRQAGAEDIALLATQPGPAACEMLALCYWAGKPYEIDFFNTQQRLVLGIVSPDSLIERIDARHYGAIALTTNTPPEERLPDLVTMHLRKAYRVARVSPNGWTILLPVGSR